MKEQFVAKRIVNIGLIFLVAIGVSVIAGMMGRMYLDQLLGMGALTVLFMVLFAFLLIYERKRKKISNNRVCSSFFFCTVLEMAKGCQSYEILCCTMLLLAGFMITHMLEDTRNKMWYLILIFAVAVLIPVLFSYFFYQEPHYDILGKAAIGAAVTDLAAAFVYPFLTKQKEA